MDGETQRKTRMDALEEKRKRLDEMRKLKQEREKNPTSSITTTTTPLDSRAVDDLVNSLLTKAEVKEQVMLPSAPTEIDILKNTVTILNSNKELQRKLSIVKNIASVIIAPITSTVEKYDKECQTDLHDDSDLKTKEYTVENYSSSSPLKQSHRRPASVKVRNNELLPDQLAPSSTLCPDLNNNLLMNH